MKKKLAALLVPLVLAACQSNNEDSNKLYDGPMTAQEQLHQLQFDRANELVEHTAVLHSAMSAYCAKNGELETVRSAWIEGMESWMALQGQEKGPEQALSLSWSMQFWPDKKNTTGRKMKELLKQSKAWSSAEIDNQSVAVRGFGAMEWLLFEQTYQLNSANGCSVGSAISQNLMNNSGKIATAWRTNPWEELSDSMWLSEYVGLLANQLDYSMKKLSRPLGEIGKPRPYHSEAWRSKSSLVLLKANLEALQQTYLANGNGLDKILREKGLDELADRITDHFETSISTWPKDESLFTLIKTREGYQKALGLYNDFEYLKYLIHEEIALNLNVVVGFNATDGD